MLLLQAYKTILGGASFRFDMTPREIRECLDEAQALSASLLLPASAMAAAIAGLALDKGVHGRGTAALALVTEACALLQPGAHCMAALGRFDVCGPRLNRGLRLARKSDSPDDFNFSINTFVMSAFLAGGATGTDLPDLVLMSLECVEVADPQNLNTSLYAPLYLGTAHFLAGNSVAADAVMVDGLARTQAAGTTLEWNSFYSAIHADACRALGDIERACARARAGIEFADKGGFRFQAAVCRAALADALVDAGAPVAEVEAVVAEVREAVGVTGGISLLPRVFETEAPLIARNHPDGLIAGLREAGSMYRRSIRSEGSKRACLTFATPQ